MKRFGIKPLESLKIVDSETNEVIGKGDFKVVQALTDIIERLERIEKRISEALK